MDATDVERLAKLETQMDNLTKMMEGINDKLDIWNQNYVPRNEINEMFRSRDERIRDIDDDQMSFRRMWPAYIAAFISVVTFILNYK